MPPGQCFRVNSDNCEEQLKEVLDYYKVQVTKDDIFSRCKVCVFTQQNDFHIRNFFLILDMQQ